jgi:hypothetical protein
MLPTRNSSYRASLPTTSRVGILLPGVATSCLFLFRWGGGLPFDDSPASLLIYYRSASHVSDLTPCLLCLGLLAYFGASLACFENPGAQQESTCAINSSFCFSSKTKERASNLIGGLESEDFRHTSQYP